jgi:hypothetical protein
MLGGYWARKLHITVSCNTYDADIKPAERSTDHAKCNALMVFQCELWPACLLNQYACGAFEFANREFPLQQLSPEVTIST